MKGVAMKRIVLLVGLILVFNSVNHGYAERNVPNQSLENRASEAVTKSEDYTNKVIEEIKSKGLDNREARVELFAKTKEYISRYVRIDNVDELMYLEGEFLKRSKEEKDIYSWIGNVIHQLVLACAKNDPLNELILTKLLDRQVADIVKAKYVDDIGIHIRKLRNQGKLIDTNQERSIIDILTKIVRNKNCESILRASASATLVSIGQDKEEVVEIILTLLDDEDDIVKEQTISMISGKNPKINEKLLSMLKNRTQYSKEVIDRIILCFKFRLTDKRVIPIFIDMINSTKNPEEFRTISSSLCNFNDPLVMSPIFKNYKRLELNDTNNLYYINNKLLLNYLPIADEDLLPLALKMIENTVSQMGGDAFTPSYYSNGVDVLKHILSHKNHNIRIAVVKIYGKIIDYFGHEDRLVAKKIRDILLNHEKVEKNENIKTDIASVLQSIKETIGIQ